MRANRIRHLWLDDRAAVNGWLTIPSVLSAEAMVAQGWDSVTIDMQHGAIGYQKAFDMLAPILASEATPLVRIPWLDEGIVGKVLDAGALGIICPMVSTRDDAERLVAACRYPPDGGRSYGPIRGQASGDPAYPQHANESVIPFAMIETAQALDNIDNILAAEGLGAIYVGPSDLSLALGCAPALDQEEEKVVDAIEYIAGAAAKHRVAAGIHNATPAYARRMIDLGYRFVSLSTDARLLAAKAKEFLAETRGEDEAADAGSVY